MTPVVAPRRSGSLHLSPTLFRASRGHIGSRFIICVSLSDCCCLFRVLIQSPGFLWWAGQQKGGEKAYIFMCVLCYYFRGVCESHSCFEEEISTFVGFFQQSDGLMLGCSVSFVAAKSNPHYGGFSFKNKPQDLRSLGGQHKNVMFSFEKSQKDFPLEDVQVRFVFLSGLVRRETSVLSESKSSFSHFPPHQFQPASHLL